MNGKDTVASNTDEEELEGLDETRNSASWGDYPVDDLLIRNDARTVHDVVRRIKTERYVMDPEFQRDFIWPQDKQSRLVESVLMRIPLPVFYMAEDRQGRLVVVDGLQRLTTFERFVTGKLKLRLPHRPDLHGKEFSSLSAKLQNRVEDCYLRFHIIDSRVPERARLDIFERVNGGMPLTRQQMRNCLFMGQATEFLKAESSTSIFHEATGGSLNHKTMRDREFVNRFCAFQLLGPRRFPGDMDGFLAQALRRMNEMEPTELSTLAAEFRDGLEHNFVLHGRHAFRKHEPNQRGRNVLNASLWDVMSTGLSRYSKKMIEESASELRQEIWRLLKDEDFDMAISRGTNDRSRVMTRFTMAHAAVKKVLDAPQA